MVFFLGKRGEGGEGRGRGRGRGRGGKGEVRKIVKKWFEMGLLSLCINLSALLAYIERGLPPIIGDILFR